MTSNHDCPGDARRSRVGSLARAGALRFVLGVPVLLALVLVPAGTIRWPAGWLFVVVLVVCLALNMVVLVALNPAVVDARLHGRRDDHPRDRRVAVVTAIAVLGIFVVAGLDFRHGWTPQWAVWRHAAGVALLVLGDLIFLWSATVNRFFTKEVAVQTERGHVVVSAGPYRFVRHPGYVGFSLMLVGIPLILGSAWACIPGVVSVGGLAVRTAFEDAMLREGLPGYRDYAARVRSRLVPGLW